MRLRLAEGLRAPLLQLLRGREALGLPRPELAAVSRGYRVSNVWVGDYGPYDDHAEAEKARLYRAQVAAEIAARYRERQRAKRSRRVLIVLLVVLALACVRAWQLGGSL